MLRQFEVVVADQGIAGLLTGADVYLLKPAEISTRIATIAQVVAAQRDRAIADGQFPSS